MSIASEKARPTTAWHTCIAVERARCFWVAKEVHNRPADAVCQRSDYDANMIIATASADETAPAQAVEIPCRCPLVFQNVKADLTTLRGAWVNSAIIQGVGRALKWKFG